MWVIDSEGSLGGRKTGLMGDTFRVVTWVDPQTGVEYLIFEDFSINSSGGSGRFMIAHSDEAQSKFKQFWTPTTFNYVNVDLDHNSYIYTALNAVLRNLYSINIHGNSLTLKIYGAIITAPNTSGLSNWNSNVNLDKIKKILEEPLERNMKKKKTENVNMTLF